MTPIFLLVGAPAVGKSTTARLLAAAFPKSVHFPVDDLRRMVVSGLVHPGEQWSPALIEQLVLARENVSRMALRYQQAGFAVTLDDFWDPNSRLEEYAFLLQQAQTHRVLLHPSRQTALERSRKRAGPSEADAYIAAGIQAVYDTLQAELPALERQGWLVVDSSGMSAGETVAAILRRTGMSAHLPMVEILS